MPLGPIIIAPEGDLDLASVGDFRAELAKVAAEAPEELVVDLTRVTFIDSTGLGALVELHRRFHRDNRRLSVVAPGGTAPAVLINLSGLRDRLSLYESRHAALGGDLRH